MTNVNACSITTCALPSVSPVDETLWYRRGSNFSGKIVLSKGAIILKLSLIYILVEPKQEKGRNIAAYVALEAFTVALIVQPLDDA